MTHKILALSLITLLLVLFACSKQSSTPEYVTSAFRSPVITGYESRDEAGNIIMYVGTPNVKTGAYPGGGNGLDISVVGFPNPAWYGLTFYCGDDYTDDMKLYMVKATTNNSFPGEANFMGSSNLVMGSQIIFETDSIRRLIQIDITNIPDGYYRAYLEGDNIQLWDNIVINHNYRPY